MGGGGGGDQDGEPSLSKQVKDKYTILFIGKCMQGLRS